MSDLSLPIQTPIWCPTATAPVLQLSEIHVWRASLDIEKTKLNKLAQSLSPDEQERVDRLRFEHHRDRAIASRGILRTILSRYLALSPDQIQFNYDSNGKPHLDSTINAQPVTFNVSHSDHLGLYAIAVDTLIGVDVERQKSVTLLAQLIQRYFSAQEQAAIVAQPVEYQEQYFFYYWTAKEALTKATGQGIADLSGTDVVITSQGVTAIYSQLPPNTQWQILLFQPQPTYAAAVVYAAVKPRTLLFFDWQID
ncbi:MAG: 4'-phosphopantetheinyl transferase superfamily protein [Leptolyngbyaceae cyanobacterium bins.302]|nr:4'-phosphopantetheinyl transferase superfamily protein [Leptolyngbyaceae cyanobacterium bins.302]